MLIRNVFLLACTYAVVTIANGESTADPGSTKGTLECIGCRATVEAFKFIYGRNVTRDAIINLASYICERFVKTESVVCYGMASQFKEEILYVVDKLVLQPARLCGLFLDNCGDSFNPLADWNVTLPPKPADVKYPDYALMHPESLRVLQISDIHFDMTYTPGSVANCDRPLCCQSDSKVNGSSVVEKAGYWGTQGACDVPYWTVENMFQNINNTEKLDYILLSGDYMSHLDWAYTKRDHIDVMVNLTTTLDRFFPGIPVFWTLGNHEGVPINSFAPHSLPEKFRPQWLYDQFWESQRKWVSKQAFNTISYRGSFVVQIYEGLRLISLNTGYCETTNFWLYLDERDPDGTLSWFVSELSRAEKDEQYVHVLSHIPPGNNECLEGWARNYYQIVNRFSQTIQAQFFGHIHIDSFTVFYSDMNDDASVPMSTLFSSPSVTTFIGLNPAYRIYQIEPGMKFRVLDHLTYFLNLTKANGMQKIGLAVGEEPKWAFLYSAKAEYGLRDLSPSSWNELITRIDQEPSVYNTFLKNSVRRDDYECDSKCRFELLCQLRRGHHNSTLCSHISRKRTSFSAYPVSYQPYDGAQVKMKRHRAARRYVKDAIRRLFTIWWSNP